MQRLGVFLGAVLFLLFMAVSADRPQILEAATSVTATSGNSAFGLKVWLDKPGGEPYAEGEPVIVFVQSERDGYVTLEYYQADGTVVHLIPNRFREGPVRIKAGETLAFGKQDGSERFIVQPPYGAETIKAIVSSIDPAEQSGKRGIQVQPDGWAESSVLLTTVPKQ